MGFGDYGTGPLRYDSRVKLVTFLFGSGWWVPWHLFFLVSAVPMFFALRSLQSERADAAQEESDSAFKILVGLAFALIAATVADGALLGWRLGAITGAMWGTIAGLGFCTIWTLVLFASAKRFVAPAADPARMTMAAVIVFSTWHAGIVAANLIALARIQS
jgi:hypothetical protein